MGDHMHELNSVCNIFQMLALAANVFYLLIASNFPGSSCKKIIADDL